MASIVKILDKTKLHGKSVFSDNKEASNGWVNGKYYINSVATNLDSSGNGTWNGVSYINGVPQ